MDFKRSGNLDDGSLHPFQVEGRSGEDGRKVFRAIVQPEADNAGQHASPVPLGHERAAGVAVASVFRSRRAGQGADHVLLDEESIGLVVVVVAGRVVDDSQLRLQE